MGDPIRRRMDPVVRSALRSAAIIWGEKGAMISQLVNLPLAISLAVAVQASHPVAAAANAVTVVGTINGGGTALMTSGPGAGGKSVSSFGIHATLYSDGSASWHVDCVDQHGDIEAGNIFGDVTKWWRNAYGLNLYIQREVGFRWSERSYPFHRDDPKLRRRGSGPLDAGESSPPLLH